MTIETLDTDSMREKRDQALKAATAAGKDPPLAWAIRQHHLTYCEYRVLLILAMHASRVDFSGAVLFDEVAKRSGLKPKRASRYVRQLIEKGLVKRKWRDGVTTDPMLFELIPDRPQAAT
jgi:DNA-binding MarR family transcriptional regulator